MDKRNDRLSAILGLAMAALLVGIAIGVFLIKIGIISTPNIPDYPSNRVEICTLNDTEYGFIYFDGMYYYLFPSGWHEESYCYLIHDNTEIRLDKSLEKQDIEAIYIEDYGWDIMLGDDIIYKTTTYEKVQDKKTYIEDQLTVYLEKNEQDDPILDQYLRYY